MLLMICWPLAFSIFGCSNAELSFKVWPVQHTEDHLCFTPSVFAAAIQLGQLSCTTAVMLEKYQTWLLPPLCPIIFDVMPRYMLQWLHTSMHQWPSFHRLDKMGSWWKSVTGGEEVLIIAHLQPLIVFGKRLLAVACMRLYSSSFSSDGDLFFLNWDTMSMQIGTLYIHLNRCLVVLVNNCSKATWRQETTTFCLYCGINSVAKSLTIEMLIKSRLHFDIMQCYLRCTIDFCQFRSDSNTGIWISVDSKLDRFFSLSLLMILILLLLLLLLCVR